MSGVLPKRQAPSHSVFNPLISAIQKKGTPPAFAPTHSTLLCAVDRSSAPAPQVKPLEKSTRSVKASMPNKSIATALPPPHRLGPYYHQKDGDAELALVCQSHDQKWHHLIKHRVMDWLAQKAIKLKALWINGVRQ